MTTVTQALAKLRTTIDQAIEYADPARAIADATDKFHESISEFEEEVLRDRQQLVDVSVRLTALEKALAPAPVPPAPPVPSPAPAPEAAPAAAPEVNAAPTGEEIAAAALAAASGQAT